MNKANSVSRKGKANLAAMYLHMDPVSGNLTVARPLDADKRTGGTKYFSISIIAKDNGKEPMMTIARGKIILLAVNDNAPVMDKLLYKRTVTCGYDARADLLDLKVKDLDNDIVNTVTVDSHSSQRYSVHKKGRDYVLRLHSNIDIKNLSDSVDVITIIASDRKFLAKAKAMVIYAPCEPNITTTTLTSMQAVTSMKPTVTSLKPPTSSGVDASVSPNTEIIFSSEDTKLTSHVSDNPMNLVTICQTFSEDKTSTTIRPTMTTAKPDVTSPIVRRMRSSVTTGAHYDVTSSSTSTRLPCTCKACRSSCKTIEIESREIEKPCNTSFEDTKNGTAKVVTTVAIATGATAASVTTVTFSAVLIKKFLLSKSRISPGEEPQD